MQDTCGTCKEVKEVVYSIIPGYDKTLMFAQGCYGTTGSPCASSWKHFCSMQCAVAELLVWDSPKEMAKAAAKR